MKKTQVALAALALVASSAALADGVTVYGQVDFAVVNSNAGTTVSGAGEGINSLWGIKGSEDLGSGLKAGFNLEQGFNAGTGSLANGGLTAGNATNGSMFNRAANISLGTDLLTVKAGVQLSPWVGAALGGTTAVGQSGVFVPALAILGNLGATSQTGAFFVGNAISLNTNIAGIAGTYLFTPGKETASGATATSDKYQSLSLSGAAGPVNLALGWESRKNLLPTTAANDVDYTNTVIAANTDLGSVRLNGAYAVKRVGSANAGNGSGEQKGWLIGASMPVTEGLAVGVTHAQNDLANKQKQTSVSALYTMSKRTSAYVTYSSFDNATVLNNGANLEGGASYSKSLLMAGVQHAF